MCVVPGFHTHTRKGGRRALPPRHPQPSLDIVVQCRGAQLVRYRPKSISAGCARPKARQIFFRAPAAAPTSPAPVPAPVCAEAPNYHTLLPTSASTQPCQKCKEINTFVQPPSNPASSQPAGPAQPSPARHPIPNSHQISRRCSQQLHHHAVAMICLSHIPV